MSYQQLFIRSIAEVMLLDEWQPQLMVKRINVLLQTEAVWVKPLVERVYQQFDPVYPEVTQRQLIEFIANNPYFLSLWVKDRDQLHIRQFNLDLLPHSISRVRCELPAIQNTQNLANWLGISVGLLENYAAHWRVNDPIKQVRHQHYHYLWKTKRRGGSRLIEAPKQRLNAIQRKIYQEILNKIPLHDACHGFRQQHSCQTYAKPHGGKFVVLHMDLDSFFNRIPQRRIYSLFTTVGYSQTVARLLAGVCCNRVPFDVVTINKNLSWQQRKQLIAPHLPQGSPSSPVLANLCAYKLDCRLAALAKKMGGEYTRYADDLAFSGQGDFAKMKRYFPVWVASIALSEGFSVNHRKTRWMHQGVSQRLVGLTLNQFPNYPRREYDQLKAILYNCTQSDPELQNRQNVPNFKAHLQGKIAYVRSLNPLKAKKLEKLYEKINWSNY